MSHIYFSRGNDTPVKSFKVLSQHIEDCEIASTSEPIRKIYKSKEATIEIKLDSYFPLRRCFCRFKRGKECIVGIGFKYCNEKVCPFLRS